MLSHYTPTPLRKVTGIVRLWKGLVVWQSLSLATDKAERILNILKSQSKTIYDRSSLVAIQLPLLKGAKCGGAERGIVRFWEVNTTSRIVHRRTSISDFIIISCFGEVNESYRIVTIPLALSNRFSGRRTLPGGNGTFNVIFRFSLLTNCVVIDYNYVRSV